MRLTQRSARLEISFKRWRDASINCVDSRDLSRNVSTDFIQSILIAFSLINSESEPEGKVNKELKSVAEEDALRKLLTSDEDSDEEKSSKDENESDEEKKKKQEDAPKENEAKPEKTKEKKKEDKKSKMQKFYDAINQGPGSGRASDFSSDSDDSDTEKVIKKKPKKADKSAIKSRSGTPEVASSANKRKAEITNSSDNSNSPQSTPAKKPKTEVLPSVPSFTNYSSSKDNFGNTEEAVRRYLMRKPMTTTELLKKVQSKKTGVSSDELVEMMTAILKKINPSKQKIQGKMYLSLKATWSWATWPIRELTHNLIPFLFIFLRLCLAK